MFDPDRQDHELVERRVLLKTQIIMASLVGGCVFFLAVVLSIRLRGGAAPAGPGPLLAYVAVGFAVMALVARAVVPTVLVRAGLRRLAARQTEASDPAGAVAALWRLFSTRTIVCGAILEGAAFFALVAYLVEGAAIALAVALLLIAALALHFPTRSGTARWIQRQRESLEQERQFRA